MREDMVLNKGTNQGTDQGVRQKVAIVTGSSSGMGYETSLVLARNGFHASHVPDPHRRTVRYQ
jgi:NADP-dependent 3-hydroxy acid dehydrogenase YdfG